MGIKALTRIPGRAVLLAALSLLLALLSAPGPLRAQAYEVIHDFQAPGPTNPSSPLVLGPDGSLYGTTAHGGHGCGNLGCGTVFRIDSTGVVTTLHEFSQTDGFEPVGDLLFASSGDLYGITSGGGTGGAGFCSPICGTVYRIDANGTFSTRHHFEGTDGWSPLAGLIEPQPGELWGTTAYGGDPPCDPSFNLLQCGTVFRLKLDGAFTTMHAFAQDEGFHPVGRLVFADDGNIYGSASGGGQVFRITLGGTLTTLYGGPGSGFWVDLIQASPTGDLVGAGTTGNGPAINQLGLGGTVSTLHEFLDFATEGYDPLTPMQAGDGLLYGVTRLSGPHSGGTVFQLDFSGTFTTIHAFEEATGWLPTSGLFQSPDGRFYGTTSKGGLHGDGTIYRLTIPGLTRFYCPESLVRRDQMAVFLLKIAHGAAFDPPDCSGQFPDVACPGQFADWIEQLAAEGITAGCAGGNYCPLSPVTRAQMAVFLLKTENGSAYTPPSCSGGFPDVPCPSLFADWIEQLATEGITGGCGGGNFCPDLPVTRAQMAAFLLKIEHGGGYVPPPCEPQFADVLCPSLFAAWIEQLYAEHITAGCAGPP